MVNSLDLPVPAYARIEVDKSFIRQNPYLNFQLGKSSYSPPSGLHFGSRFLQPDGEMSRLVEHLNSSQVSAVEDQQSYVGITLFDLLTESDDRRQAVFIRNHFDAKIYPTFIDFGHHFRGPSWKRQFPLLGPFKYSIYKSPKLWANTRIIKYWLAKFRTQLPYSLSQSISQVPSEWYTGSAQQMKDRYLQRIADFESVVSGFIMLSSQSVIGSASLPGREATL